jgi:hypothetical protein
MPLTDLQIKRTKPKDEAYKPSDGGTMYLWVTPSGGKRWRWAFRYEGKAQLMTFGSCFDVPLAAARKRLVKERSFGRRRRITWPSGNAVSAAYN